MNNIDKSDKEKSRLAQVTDNNVTKRKICFVGADNYPVLANLTTEKQFGGESVQQTLLAKCFVDLGYEVSMIVKDHGQPDIEYIDGIKVIKGFLYRGGIPVVRWLYPRLTGMYKAIKLADADYYFDSCAGVSTGVVGYFCKKYERCHLFRLAHDSDVIPGQQLIRFWRDRKIYEYGLKNADIISAQGVVQQKLLKENYGLDSVPVNMAVELPNTESDIPRDIDILWVNNFRPFKRPAKAVLMAEKLPQYQLHMIGGSVDGHQMLFDDVKASAQQVDNLTFHGSVPFSSVNDYFERTRVFINTSDQEGFPNSFLQAWIRGVPVISYFDPDGLIAKLGLGGAPKDEAEMIAIVRSLLEDEDELRRVGKRCTDFAKANYAAQSVALKYQELILASDKSV